MIDYINEPVDRAYNYQTLFLTALNFQNISNGLFSRRQHKNFLFNQSFGVALLWLVNVNASNDDNTLRFAFHIEDN